MKIKVDSKDWQQVSPPPGKLKEGLEKFGEALERDIRDAAERGSGLPKDWRNRIFK